MSFLLAKLYSTQNHKRRKGWRQGHGKYGKGRYRTSSIFWISIKKEVLNFNFNFDITLTNFVDPLLNLRIWSGFKLFTKPVTEYNTKVQKNKNLEKLVNVLLFCFVYPGA